MDRSPAAYEAIFEQRGDRYDLAMAEHPRARDEEFSRLIAWAELRSGHRVCDVPSGAGYLHRYVPAGTVLVHVETSATFARRCAATSPFPVVRGTFEHLPLRSGSCDRVLSLAALHHVVDLSPFCEEAWRVLAPGGVLCIADAASDSPVAEFLNVFVHRHNSMGHVGRFLDGSVAATLADVGFHVERAAIVPYTWRFASPDAMVAFTQLLFGLDRATPEEVRAGIAHHLGYWVEDGCCHLRWELLFLRAVKR